MTKKILLKTEIAKLFNEISKEADFYAPINERGNIAGFHVAREHVHSAEKHRKVAYALAIGTLLKSALQLRS